MVKSYSRIGMSCRRGLHNIRFHPTQHAATVPSLGRVSCGIRALLKSIGTVLLSVKTPIHWAELAAHVSATRMLGCTPYQLLHLGTATHSWLQGR